MKRRDSERHPTAQSASEDQLGPPSDTQLSTGSWVDADALVSVVGPVRAELFAGSSLLVRVGIGEDGLELMDPSLGLGIRGLHAPGCRPLVEEREPSLR
jgi:hypothetical protein